MEPQEGEPRWVLGKIVDGHLCNMGTVVVEGTDCIDGIHSKLGQIEIGQYYRVVLEMGHEVVGIGIGIGSMDPWLRVRRFILTRDVGLGCYRDEGLDMKIYAILVAIKGAQRK